MEEPFTIYKVLPRTPIPLSDSALQALDVGGNLLVLEVDLGGDFLKFFRNLVRYDSGLGVL